MLFYLSDFWKSLLLLRWAFSKKHTKVHTHWSVHKMSLTRQICQADSLLKKKKKHLLEYLEYFISLLLFRAIHDVRFSAAQSIFTLYQILERIKHKLSHVFLFVLSILHRKKCMCVRACVYTLIFFFSEVLDLRILV